MEDGRLIRWECGYTIFHRWKWGVGNINRIRFRAREEG